MTFYGIDFVAHELGVHASSLRRWEVHGLIAPERATMGKTTLRIYDEKTVRVLRRAKDFMDTGPSSPPVKSCPFITHSIGQDLTVFLHNSIE